MLYGQGHIHSYYIASEVGAEEEVCLISQIGSMKLHRAPVYTDTNRTRKKGSTEGKCHPYFTRFEGVVGGLTYFYSTITFHGALHSTILG